MRCFAIWLLAAFALFVIEVVELKSVTAQQTTDDWQVAARARLQGIYSKGEFRAQPNRREWLEDSSGFVMPDRDPNTGKQAFYKYDVESGKRTVGQKPNKPNLLVSPNSERRLVRRNDGIFVVGSDSKSETRLVERDPERDVYYGNLRWSPSGKFVSFVEHDRSQVRFRTMLVPDDPSYPGTIKRRFARVGEKIESLRVGVVDVTQNKLQWLSVGTGDDAAYLRVVEWIPHVDELFVETLSRFRDKREFYVAKPGDAPRSIFREVNDAWAVGSHEINSGVEWLKDGKSFVFISEKDGWRQAYRLKIENGEVIPLMKGEFDLIDRVFLDEPSGTYYFYASPENGTQRYLYRVPLDGSCDMARVTPSENQGTHRYDVSPNGKWAIHTHSTANDPPQVNLIELPSHGLRRVLEDNAPLKARAERAINQPIEFVQVNIGDNVEMDVSMIKPKDFDPNRKYPIFVYVYGEPYAQTVLDEWGVVHADFHRLVADLGYVVVSIDNRGTPCPKGAAWRRSVFGSLGPLSTEDQAAALKKLADDFAFLDLDRVGIWGWSGGGSNTLNALFRKPDLYDVGISVVPKPQPWLYNAWFQEIYMRTREVNAKGYEESAPINFAEGLRGKLLIITGSGETNTHIQIIEGLVDRLIELGKAFDYMVYPNRNHGLREGSGTVVHVRMLILRYLVDHLPRGPR